LHRASAHVMAGWNVKIPALAIKVELARQAYDDLAQAQRIEQLLWGLTRGRDRKPTIGAGHRALMQAIDAGRAPGEMLAGLHHLVKPHLRALYGELLPALDPMCDATALQILPAQLPVLDAQIAWAGAALPALGLRAAHPL